MRLDGKSYFLALLTTLLLVGGGGAKGCVEGDIALVLASRPRLDVTAALALRVSTRTPSALAAGDFVQGVVYLAWGEGFARPYLLTAFPPMGVAAVENFLRTRLGSAVLRFSFAGLLLV